MSSTTFEGAVIRRYAVLFWDFDGVIKDSVSVKGAAFEQLFKPFGPHVAARVRAHHEEHGGMSRYEKLPLYLEWAGLIASEAEVARYCERMSALVRQAVVDCEWVAGVREYLESSHARQQCILLTAAPQEEISSILAALQIATWFRQVFGAPLPKAVAIERALQGLQCSPQCALLIGDSQADFDAAKAAGIDFLLRRTPLNVALQKTYAGPQCDDFRGV